MRKLIPLLMAAGLFTQAAEAKLVCWTDDKGQKACGDRVPPQYAKKDREVLDAQGRVVKKQERQKTAEEVAKAEAEAAAARAEKERLEKQTKYDKYLLQTFGSIAELEGVRDNRVRTLDGRITIAEKAVTDNEAALASLKDRAAKARESGKEPDAKLLKSIGEFEASLVDNLKGVASLKKEREDIQAKFADDIQRYKGLRQGVIQVGSAAPSAAARP